MSELIRMDGEYTTRDGREVRVLCVDRRKTGKPVVVLVQERWGCESTFLLFGDGRYGEDGPTANDLIPKPKRETRWLNVYPLGSLGGTYLKESRRAVDEWAAADRVGVLKIDYENGQPVAVSLEPLSKEGA